MSLYCAWGITCSRKERDDMMSSKKYKQKNKLVGGKDHMPD